MPDTTYFAPGQWNYICELCGGSFKSSTAEKTWDGRYVCKSHKERRNPQDFVRGVRGEQPLPWTRSETPLPSIILQEDGISNIRFEGGLSILLR
jgi:hypothetical protein